MLTPSFFNYKPFIFTSAEPTLLIIKKLVDCGITKNIASPEVNILKFL